MAVAKKSAKKTAKAKKTTKSSQKAASTKNIPASKAKTPAGAATEVSKRKSRRTSKTKAIKVKKTKVVATKVETPKAEVVERKVAKVETARTRRVAQRAIQPQVKEEKPVLSEVASMRLTELEAMEYTEDEYAAMLEMYDSTICDIKEGEIVSGRILGVTHDDVIVDVGFKSEGVIPISEFPGQANIVVGAEIDVFLEAMEDSSGQLLLSKQKADFLLVWDKIRVAHDAGDLVEGKVVKRIKGGLVVDVMGVDAFLPGSQVALRQVPDFDALVNTTLEVKIIKLNKNRRNIVISRRVVLEEDRAELRDKLLEEIAVDQVRKGVVKNITDFGVFIDLGGVDGLLHITDMSWGRIKHPSELCTLGEDVEVKILDFDDKTQRISLGLKQLSEYPWENIEQKYPIGLKVTGRVVSITDYGAFVELEQGIEGLIHISEMSWTQHIKHPSKIMNVNDKIEVVVLSVDKDAEKISLGIKQLEEDPWKKINERYPLGNVISGKVRNLTAFGAFVELEEGIDGLVHISDMSWTRRIQHPSEIMRKGDEVTVKITKVDHDNRRISLGFKQLQEDPWPELEKKFAVGSEALGKIMRVLDRGLVVELDGSVEGFVPAAQLGKKDITSPSQLYSEGQEIPLSVIEFDASSHRIALSVEAYYKNRDKSELDSFISKQTESKGDSSMAGALEDAGLTSSARKTEEPAAKEPASEPKAEAVVEKQAPAEPEPASSDETAPDTKQAGAEEEEKKEEEIL